MTLDIFDLGASLAADATLLEGALEFFGHILVFHGNQAREHFEHRDLAAETRKNRGKLDANRTGADNRERSRDGGQVQDLDIAEDGGIGSQAGEHARFRTGGENDVLCLDGLLAFGGADENAAAPLERCVSGKCLDLVLLREAGEPFGVCVDDLVLTFEDEREVETWVLAVNALLRGIPEVVPDFGSVQQRLRRDTAYMKTGAAKFGRLLDKYRFKTVLTGAEGRSVSTGTATDNRYLIGHQTILAMGKLRSG